MFNSSVVLWWPQKLLRSAAHGILLWALLVGEAYAEAPDSPEFYIVVNKEAGLSNVTKLQLRALLLGHTNLLPSGQPIYLVFSANRDVVKGAGAAAGLTVWQIETAWQARTYAQSIKSVYTNNASEVTQQIRKYPGSVAVVGKNCLKDLDMTKITLVRVLP